MQRLHEHKSSGELMFDEAPLVKLPVIMIDCNGLFGPRSGGSCLSTLKPFTSRRVGAAPASTAWVSGRSPKTSNIVYYQRADRHLFAQSSRVVVPVLDGGQ
jgi:hypothetical protein